MGEVPGTQDAGVVGWLRLRAPLQALLLALVGLLAWVLSSRAVKSWAYRGEALYFTGHLPNQLAAELAAAEGKAAGTDDSVDRSVFFAASPTADLTLRLSGFTCNNPEIRVHQICDFTNVLLHQGELLYVVADERAARKLKLPSPPLFEYTNTPTFDFNVHDTVVVLTMEAVRKRLLAVEGEEVLVAEFAVSVLQRTRAYSNWFWALNGAGNTFHRMCKYYGACTRPEVLGTAILQPTTAKMHVGLGYEEGLSPKAWPSVRQLMSCFGPVFMVSPPAAKRVGMETDSRLVVLRRMLAGIGDDVCEPMSARGPKDVLQYNSANTTMALRRVRYLRQCAGLPASPPPATGPSVLMINRPYSDGRHILGLDEAYAQVQRRLPPGVPVRLYLPRSESLAMQAAIFASANVIVVPHGAGNANFNFLPHDAVVVAVYALMGRHALDKAHVKSLPAPPYNVTLLSVDSTQHTEPLAAALGNRRDFTSLKAADQAYFLSELRMNGKKRKQLAKLLNFSTKDWMDFAAYRPEPAAVVGTVLQALELVQAKIAARMAGQAVEDEP